MREFAQRRDLCFVAGRYEGIDQRWIDVNVDAVVSLGDYVLSGGELAAAVVVDACVRLLPGALGDGESTQYESFADTQGGRLDWPVCFTGGEASCRKVCRAVIMPPSNAGDLNRPSRAPGVAGRICSRALNCRSKSVRSW